MASPSLPPPIQSDDCFPCRPGIDYRKCRWLARVLGDAAESLAICAACSVADQRLIGTMKVGAKPGLTEFRQGKDSVTNLGNRANMEGLLGSTRAQPRLAEPVRSLNRGPARRQRRKFNLNNDSAF